MIAWNSDGQTDYIFSFQRHIWHLHSLHLEAIPFQRVSSTESSDNLYKVLRVDEQYLCVMSVFLTNQCEILNCPACVLRPSPLQTSGYSCDFLFATFSVSGLAKMVVLVSIIHKHDFYDQKQHTNPNPDNKYMHCICANSHIQRGNCWPHSR